MAIMKPVQSRKRSTNVSLSEDLVRQAKEFGVPVSTACEEGLAKAVKVERERRWIEDNKAAFESWNRYVAENGLPLARYRTF
ncbi:type II toxin-antitoxin system CcdA family antitoxin [Sphingomonas sp. GCM10030256]|uniref:type II toxin-antitoxin system CcdA family antitoxin n=1 Tax=Sphingomonas sp. GCM10030256 TaxID=3273427 RepID=UPI003620C72D